MTYLKNLMGLFHYIINYHIYCPIKYKLTERMVLKDRLRLYSVPMMQPHIARLYRMRHYKRDKEINNMYRENMEIIAKIAEYYKIPQYKLVERLNPNSHGVIYYAEPWCSDCPWFTEFYRYFIYLLPSKKQIKIDFYNFFLCIRKGFKYYISDYISYWWAGFTLLKIKKVELGEQHLILRKWIHQDFYRENRLRREANVRKYKNA